MSVTALPPKLWRPQLKRLAVVCGTLAVFTLLGAGARLPGSCQSAYSCEPETPLRQRVQGLSGKPCDWQNATAAPSAWPGSSWPLLHGRAPLPRQGRASASCSHALWRADSVPPVLQPRSMPAQLEQLPDIASAGTSYRFVLFHWAIVTLTRRSLRLAVSLASLTFTALQACVRPWLLTAALLVQLAPVHGAGSAVMMSVLDPACLPAGQMQCWRPATEWLTTTDSGGARACIAAGAGWHALPCSGRL